MRHWLVAILLVAACGADPPSTVAATGEQGSTTAMSSSSASSSSSMSTGSVPDESSSGTADPCAAAVIVPQSDPDATPSGFTRCANGMLRRVDAVQCVGPMPADACTNPDASACQVAADCVERGFGACVDAFDGIGSCTCVYGCETDDDCPTGEVCVCGGDAPGYPAVNACVPADCTTDIDCPGGACALGQVDACLARYGLACISGAEECVSQEQCEEFEECGPHDPDLPWTCEPAGTC